MAEKPENFFANVWDEVEAKPIEKPKPPQPKKRAATRTPRAIPVEKIGVDGSWFTGCTMSTLGEIIGNSYDSGQYAQSILDEQERARQRQRELLTQLYNDERKRPRK